MQAELVCYLRGVHGIGQILRKKAHRHVDEGRGGGDSLSENRRGCRGCHTCLLAKTRRTASRSSSSASILISSSRASFTRSRSLLSTTKIRPAGRCMSLQTNNSRINLIPIFNNNLTTHCYNKITKHCFFSGAFNMTETVII